jgi:hypothetical protein
MKKRDFFKRLLGITAAAVVAPKALLAEEETLVATYSHVPESSGLYEPSAVTRSYVSSVDMFSHKEMMDIFNKTGCLTYSIKDRMKK